MGKLGLEKHSRCNLHEYCSDYRRTGATENYKHRGLIPRAISHIFREIIEKPHIAYQIRISYLEIYNEQIVDLLSNLSDAQEFEAPLTVIEDKHGFSMVKGSSRSRVESTEKVILSKLNLVDLAGSERLSKTRTEGENEHMEETISTLRFATRMMCVENNPEIVIQFDPLALIKKYEKEIKDLKQELAMHDSLSNRSHVQYESYGENQRVEIQKLVKAYLDNEDNELEAHVEDVANSVRKSNGLSVEKNLSLDTNDHEMQKALNEIERDEKVGEVELFGFGAPTPGKMSSLSFGRSFKKKKAKFLSLHSESNGPVAVDFDAEERGASEEQALSPSFPPINGFTTKNHRQVIAQSYVSRAQEFEVFKKEKGYDIFKILSDNKEKKKFALDLEYSILEKLKGFKHQYKERFEELKQTRSEIGYCVKLVDQCRQKLMLEFDQWFEVLYGGQVSDLEAGGQHEDVMDIGERFDRLQIEKMSQEDPDSLPYYNARKNTERRNLKR
ncbi:Kinesin-like protein kif9 [Phlyctochytrium planicorne]|nr:Kinesin-like protein kif9 [Phlyctochytrium planicorne]